MTRFRGAKRNTYDTSIPIARAGDDRAWVPVAILFGGIGLLGLIVVALTCPTLRPWLRGVAALAAAGFGTYTAAYAALNFWADWRHARVGVRIAEREGRLTILEPGPDGRKGVVWDGVTFYDMDTARVFEQNLTLAMSPLLEALEKEVESIRHISRALPPHSYHYETTVGDALLPDGQARAAQEAGGVKLREYVTLSELTRRYGVGSYHHLLLGEMIGEDGQYAPVWGDLTAMVHVLVSGATSWGKSTLLEAMAKQLILARDTDVALVDLGCNTFGALAPYGRYPIAETTDLVVSLFQELCREMERRRDLIAQIPTAKTLDDYNRATGDSLLPLVVFVDEAMVLFDKSSKACGLATRLAQMGRKYAIDLVLGGTDFKSDTLPTEARGCCGARVAFHLEEPTLSRSIIRSAKAVDLTVPGRALLRLPQVAGLLEMQCPIVDRWDDLPEAGEVIELGPPQEVETVETRWTPEQEADVLRLHEEGKSGRYIEKVVFKVKTPGGATYNKVKAILAKHAGEGN